LNVALARAFGSYLDYERWEKEADINHDDETDMKGHRQHSTKVRRNNFASSRLSIVFMEEDATSFIHSSCMTRTN